MYRAVGRRVAHSGAMGFHVASRFFSTSPTGAPYRVFMVAGEPSGDNIGASLIKALKCRSHPRGVDVYGIGGPHMETAGLRACGIPFKHLSVMGFAEVLATLPRFWYYLWCAHRKIVQYNPDVVVTVDSKGFNLRLLKRMKRHGPKWTPAVQYVGPSVWAFRDSVDKARGLRGVVDRLLTILPMEASIFEDAGVKATFVGHPVMEASATCSRMCETPPSQEKPHRKEGNPEGFGICLLPGSRPMEVDRHLEVFWKGVLKYVENNITASTLVSVVVPTVSITDSQVRRFFSEQNIPAGVRVRIEALSPASALADTVTHCSVALAASGTAAVELFFAGVPTVVGYRGSMVTELVVMNMIARKHLTVKFASLPNILLDREVVPELLFSKCTPDNIADRLSGMTRLAPDDVAALERLMQPPHVKAHRQELPRCAKPSCIAASQILSEVRGK